MGPTGTLRGWGSLAAAMLIVLAFAACDETGSTTEATPADVSYFATEGLTLDPPAALAGSEGAAGSGCEPGSGDLPDGIWLGVLATVAEKSMDIDVACLYPPGSDPAGTCEYGGVSEDDVACVTTGDGETLAVGVASEANVHTLLPDQLAYCAGTGCLGYCAGSGCLGTIAYGRWQGPVGDPPLVWLYVNEGRVTEVVEQYMP